MRVICINNKPIEGLENRKLSLLKEGLDYDVVQVIEAYGGLTGFQLKGIDSSNPAGYDSRRFIPLSDISETEFERYKLEPCTQQ